MSFAYMKLPLAFLLFAPPITDAKSFLDSESPHSDTHVSDMLTTLIGHPSAAGLNEAVRNQHAKDAHSQNQKDLWPMFKSLPKNPNANLGLPAARYALHRLFEQRHRWFVRGLHPMSRGGNDTSGRVQVSMVRAWQTITAFDKKGLSLPALAALAGLLEELIHSEVASHLGSFYKSFGQNVDDTISSETMEQIADSYMTIYISGASFQNNSKDNIEEDSDFMLENTKDWTETREWVKSTTKSAEELAENCEGDVKRCKFQFNESVQVVQKVVEKYGHFNDEQCHKLKNKLLEMEDKQTGRVKLADFYKAGLSGAWEFNEKSDYLRSLGALDETDKNDPKVIVPNYVSSWVNCLSSSDLYSVCCRNDCEDYMQAIEKHIAGPMAEPDKIISVVDTDPAFHSHGESSRSPPKLAALRHRLMSIADTHRGKVPIHGRLFAQWMHHTFPATCPYPHESGKTNPQTPDEWMVDTGHANIKASQEEVHKVVSQAKEQKVEESEAAGGELPWTDVEELLIVRPTQLPTSSGTSLHDIVAAVEMCSVIALVAVVIYMASLHRRLKVQHQKAIV